MNEERHTRLFSNRSEITYGAARVIFAGEAGNRPAGWVLPGGRRTGDRDVAQVAAENMHQLIVDHARSANSEATALIRSRTTQEKTP